MSRFTLGTEAVYAVQRCSRELAESVWSVRFYDCLLDVLENGTWQEYSTEAFGRPCRFEDVREFLTHEDGLRWPSVPEVLRMIELVRDCLENIPRHYNDGPGEPVQALARKALDALAAKGVELPPALALKARPIPEAGPAPAPGMPSPNPAGRRGKEQDGDHHLDPERGTTQRNIIRRIKRDHPEVAEALERGEFRSARAAGIAAGFIKPSPPTVRLVDDVEKVAENICRHLNRDQLVALATAIAERVRDGDRQ